MSQAREPPILRQRNNHLPDDIVLNILARLPIKSVLRFRFVCKPRNSSITSPNFFSTHLNIINNNNGYLIHMPWATRPMNPIFRTTSYNSLWSLATAPLLGFPSLKFP
ncbi:hypothetical protein RGQ29_017187 [Quercus rubra]|uniref:F-box domain-containing protein n=1 Tax=Quercus rubra TaxID=3512 RepID=A0AAN7FGH1_QUERU|nr:hypothetical protein RGQ29_017187 [Quercus rubra]